MRLFLAILPDDESLAKIRNSMRKMGKIKRNFRFVPYEQMHMTIKFLGANVSEYSRDRISERLKEIIPSVKPIKVELGKIRYGFRNQQKPTVMYYDVKETEEINDLVSKVHEEIKQLQLPDVIKIKDRKKFIHHITIARVKRSVSNSLVRQTKEVINKIPEQNIEFEAQELHMIRSTLTPTGPNYEKLGKFDINSKI